MLLSKTCGMVEAESGTRGLRPGWSTWKRKGSHSAPPECGSSGKPWTQRVPIRTEIMGGSKSMCVRAQNIKQSWDVGIKRMSLCMESQTFYTRRNSMWMAELYMKFVHLKAHPVLLNLQALLKAIYQASLSTLIITVWG